ncbi:hypothetical protein J4217_03080 [Candidatus Pacearchaeota archaeon]|nr:hypothetical protein [Candidatus Pacearchaeota archaeon]
MKQVQAYFYELCRKFDFGDEGAKRIKVREQIPLKGICTSLNGLLVSLHDD